MSMIAALLAIFAIAGFAPLVCRATPRFAGWLLAALPLGLAIWFLSLLPEVTTGEPILEKYAWAPSLGVQLNFQLDGLALLFSLLITGIGAAIVVYAGGYLAGDERLGRLLMLLFLFMGSMLGLVLADNLILLFVFWELTSITSYLLIGFNHERPESRAGALQALLITGGGGLALLAGLMLLGQIGQSLDLSRLLSGDATTTVRQSPLYPAVLALVVAGAFTKSAQFPFHFWLPSAMEAPTPVSAYLHSATMVKAGVYLLARLHPLLGGTPEWEATLTIGGLLTMVVGGLLAVLQVDLKRILAYSTISALGTMVLMLGVAPGESSRVTGAVEACVVFLLAHALYKGALFMVAGAIDHETGTRQIDRLGGLRRKMPVTALVAVVGAVSLAGFGPLLSFIGKELVLEATLGARWWTVLVPAMIFSGAMFTAVAGLVAIRPFFGTFLDTPKKPHEAPPSLWLGPALLAGLGVALGFVPTVVEPLVKSAVTAIQSPPDDFHLALWHGLNLALAMSAVSVATGIAVYLLWGSLRRFSATWDSLARFGPQRAYNLLLNGLLRFADLQTDLLQSGYLRHYVIIVLVTTCGLVGATFALRGSLAVPVGFAATHYEIALAVLIVLSAVAAIFARSRLGAIAALGVVGYTVAVFFVLLGAPDVAMTQFLIETLTVILFVLVFYHLPEPPEVSRPLARVRDAAVAGSVGILMAVLVMVAVDVDYPTISSYYATHSLEEAHGRNVVNVILVDFRGLDTLGEITVLAVAGIGVYSLLKLRPAVRERSVEPPKPVEDASP